MTGGYPLCPHKGYESFCKLRKVWASVWDGSGVIRRASLEEKKTAIHRWTRADDEPNRMG